MSQTNGAVLSPEAQALAALTNYDSSEELGFESFAEETFPTPAFKPPSGEAPPTFEPDAEGGESTPTAADSVSTQPSPGGESAATASTDEEEEELDPRSVKTKVNIINSPWSKGLLIAGGAGVVFLFLYLFLHGVTSRPEAPPPVPHATESPAMGSDDGAAPDETSKYKTEAALTTQKTALNQVAPKPTPTLSPKAGNSPSPLQPALAPPISNVPLAPLSPAQPLSALAAANQTAVVPPDPVQQWQTAARLGSYGRLTPGSSGATAASTPVAPTPVQPFAPFVPPAPPPVSSTGTQPLSSLRASSSTPGLRDHPLSSVLVGSSVAAQLATAIVLSGDNTSPIAPDSPSATRYLVRLTADLKDADGNVALPAGTQVVVIARSFSQQTGNAEFVATSLIVNNKEYAAPKDSLVIRSTNGGLLAFGKQNTGGGVFKSILPAFFAGIAQAGQILNQPSSSATVSGGSVSATTTSSSPSPVAGFAQGFGNNLSQQMQQQAQAANQKAASAPASWSLDAGSSVLVFVNSSFQL